MNQKKLSNWLKAVCILIGVCGLIVYALILPGYGASIAAANPEFKYAFWPWMVFLWGTGIPCYAALVIAWSVFDRIGKDNSFCEKNAVALKRISTLAVIDVVYFFVGELVLLFLNMNHPGVFLISQLFSVLGISVAIASAALSHLIYKAASIREENELTI